MAAQRDASDILLVIGSAITLRIHGVLTAATTKPLSSDDIRSLLLPLLTAEQSAQLQKNRVVDFCFLRGSIG